MNHTEEDSLMSEVYVSRQSTLDKNKTKLILLMVFVLMSGIVSDCLFLPIVFFEFEIFMGLHGLVKKQLFSYHMYIGLYALQYFVKLAILIYAVIQNDDFNLGIVIWSGIDMFIRTFALLVFFRVYMILSKENKRNNI
uniref:Uncharacterized protein n=1 Tax=viral metagenome TaxID=1070528 RepID=A0A6C0ECS7_9ZZZZ